MISHCSQCCVFFPFQSAGFIQISGGLHAVCACERVLARLWKHLHILLSLIGSFLKADRGKTWRKKGKQDRVVLILLINVQHDSFYERGLCGFMGYFWHWDCYQCRTSTGTSQHGENFQALVTFVKQINSFSWNSTPLVATEMKQPLYHGRIHTRHMDLLCHTEPKTLFPGLLPLQLCFKG